MSGPGKNDNLNKRISEFFVTFLGFIIELDVLLKKITAAKQQRDLADDFPYLNLLFVKLIYAQQELRKIFLTQFNKEFNINGIGYQDMIKLFSLDPNSYGKTGIKNKLENFQYFNTPDGRNKIIKLLSSLFSDQDFAHSLINTAGLSTDLKKYLDRNREELVYKRGDAEGTNVYAIFYPKNAQDDSFIFAMQAVLRFPLLSGDLLKEIDKESSLHAVVATMLNDTRKIGILANGMQVDYGSFNLNPAELLGCIDALSKIDARNEQTLKSKSLLQFFKLLTMIPVVLDKNKIGKELSMLHIGRLKQIQEIFASFGSTPSERINYIGEQISTILKPESIKNFMPQIQSAMGQVDKLMTNYEEKIAKKPILADKTLYNINDRDVEYLINRYLQSFAPPFSKVDFYTANYILNYVRASNLALSELAVLVLQHVGDRNATTMGKAASKMRKFSNAAAKTVLSSAASKSKDDSSSSDDESSVSPKDEKTQYREDLVAYLRLNPHKASYDMLKLLVDETDQPPMLPPRPDPALIEKSRRASLERKAADGKATSVEIKPAQAVKQQPASVMIPLQTAAASTPTIKPPIPPKDKTAQVASATKPQVTFMAPMPSASRTSVEKVAASSESTQDAEQRTKRSSVQARIVEIELKERAKKEALEAAKKQSGGENKRNSLTGDNTRHGSGNFGDKGRPGSGTYNPGGKKS